MKKARAATTSMLALTGPLTLVLACALPVSPPGERTTAAPLIDGRDDVGDPAVVALLRAGAPVCSGTIVTPDAVLTAAHCLTLAPIEAVRAVDGSTTIDLRAARAVVHPGYDEATMAHDVGVLFLRDPTPIAPATESSAVDGTLVGRAVRIVGFGVTSATPDSATRSKHEGRAVVARVDDDSITLTPDPAQACTGDSGGAVFADVDGIERLIAVVSAGDGACRTFTRAMRVDAYRASFIDPAIAPERAPTGHACSFGPHHRALDGWVALLLAVAMSGLLRRRRNP